MATNGEEFEAREGDGGEEGQSSGNWLGRWVMMLAIIAFLIVYVAQLWRGTGLVFTVLISTAAMGVVAVGGMIVRQMLLRTASRERAEGILEQMHELRRERDGEGGGG